MNSSDLVSDNLGTHHAQNGSISSLALLGQASTVDASDRGFHSQWYRAVCHDSPADALLPRNSRYDGFYATRVTEQPSRPLHDGIFSPSESYLIESAREDILLRRRCSYIGRQQLNTIFQCTMAVSIVCPLAGLLALFGVLDSTIAWRTKGEIQSFTKGQRANLKRLLLVQVILYTTLATTLAIYFSVGL